MISETSGSTYWQGKRVCLTGGGGFLGGFVQEALKARGADHVFVPRQTDYDLVQGDDVRRLLTEVRPEIVLHLAAHVGGIGANQAHPGEFFYDNL
ncbi:MAG TPA: NAD-dependent epimerase/dehydratase family protein, partial [Anaerolineales bacterium]|nr:NAD-dependent epimerase/dehydratase family protein [Anaerolineales bacterium]